MFIKNILNCLRLKYSLCFISNISIRDVLGGKIPRHFMLHFNTLWFHVILFHGAVIHNVTSWLRRISACGSKDQSWETLSKTYKWYSLYLQLKTAISGFTDQFVFFFWITDQSDQFVLFSLTLLKFYTSTSMPHSSWRVKQLIQI